MDGLTDGRKSEVCDDGWIFKNENFIQRARVDQGRLRLHLNLVILFVQCECRND